MAREASHIPSRLPVFGERTRTVCAGNPRAWPAHITRPFSQLANQNPRTQPSREAANTARPRARTERTQMSVSTATGPQGWSHTASRVTPSSGSPVWQCEPPRQQLVGPQTNRDKRSCLHTSGYTAKFNLSPFIQHFSNPVQLVNYIQLSFELISINNSNF